MRIRKGPGYSFDDVLLVPQFSTIGSRGDANLSTWLGSLQLKLPLLSSNMDTVTEVDMACAMGRAGGAGVLHRFANEDCQTDWIKDLYRSDQPKIASVGLNYKMDYLKAWHAQYDLDAVCIDVAHGDHQRVMETVSAIRSEFSHINIIAGNVATSSAARRLVEAGANIIKVGIGPGSVCSTRVVSGHGVPQLSAILDVSEEFHHLRVAARKQDRVFIIADGGIRYPGDIVKALAAGADAVMLGSLLAGTDEAPGARIVEHGSTFKTFRGMASREVQQEKRTERAPRVEGVTAKVPYKGPLIDTLHNLEAGIRSGLSYSGARNLEELRDAAEFVVVTGNTLKESHPHHPYRL
jgi:IMP dehydrogenase